MFSANLQKFVTHVETTEVRKEWLIENFFLLNKKNGEELRSPLFTLDNNNQCKWYIKFYPNGDKEENQNHISLFFNVGSDNSKHNVEFEFSILNKNKIKEIKYATVCNYKGKLKDFGRGYSKFISIDFLKANQEILLPNGNLTICFSAKVGTDINTYEFDRNHSIMCDNLAEQCARQIQIGKDLGKLLKTTTLTDIELTVRDCTKLKAHRLILAARSPVFQTMFANDMVENIESKINITDFSSEIVSKMLEFIYTGKIDLNDIDNIVEDLYSIADKYQVTDLKDLCENILFRSLSVENAINLLILADRHSSENFKSRVIKFIVSHKKDVILTPQFIELKSKQLTLLIDLFCADS